MERKSFSLLYKIGFFLILFLPVLTLPPYFSPPDWPKTVVMRSLLAVMLCLLLYQFFFKRNQLQLPSIKKNVIAWAMAALFLVYAAACVFSVDPRFSVFGSPYRGGGFLSYAFYFVFALLFFFMVEESDFKMLWNFSLAVGLVVSGVAFIQLYGLFSSFFIAAGSRPGSTLGNPIFLGMYMLLLFFLTAAFLLQEKKRALKFFYAACLVVFVATIIISGSRAAYFGFIAGVIAFLLLYPKKIWQLKIGMGIFLTVVIALVAYANLVNPLPSFITQNRILDNLFPRLSLSALTHEERFRAWQTELQVISAKPILGWGPENLAPGFDQFYNPLVTPSPWWDRAHNVFLGIGADAGILGILAYIALFISLFWSLEKGKRRTDNVEKKVILSGIEATLVAYLVANFFSFDFFGSYLLFFFLIAYTLKLTYVAPVAQSAKSFTAIKVKKLLFAIALVLLVAFLWQWNLVPFYVNANINEAQTLINENQCAPALATMNGVLPIHTFLDSYVRLEYAEFIQSCVVLHPENTASYLTQGVQLIQQAVAIQPLYTRYWIFLGSAEVNLTEQQQDQTAKNTLLNQAKAYFDRATELAPRHPEIPVDEAQMELAAGNYLAMETYADQCASMNPNLGDCYWARGIAEIYLKSPTAAKADLATAAAKEYPVTSTTNLNELSNAYGSIMDYQDLIPVYLQLVLQNPTLAQYHSSLAFFYKAVGDYQDARAQALLVLQLSPSSKSNVEAFLSTLP